MTLHKIHYTLDPRTIMKGKLEGGKDVLEILFRELEKRLPCERIIRLEKSYNGIKVVVCRSEELTEKELRAINQSISEAVSIGEIGMVVSEVSADDVLKNGSLSDEDKRFLSGMGSGKMPEEEIKQVAPQNQETKQEQAEIPDEEDVFEAVEGLVAMNELKAWAKEMKQLSAKAPDKKLLASALMGMSYLVSINSGNGRTKMLEMMGKVLCRVLGKAGSELKEVTIEPDREADGYNIEKVINEFSYVGKESETLYVFALNIEKFQNNTNMMAWLRLLDGIWENNKKAIFVFVLPYMEQAALYEMHQKIEDVLPNRILTEKPMTNENYLSFFENYFKKYDIKLSEEAYTVIPKKLAEEKSDGRFYGINTVTKICDEILYQKLKNACLSEDVSLCEITGEDITALLHRPLEGEANGMTGMQKLESLVSLENVKSVIKEIVATIKMQKRMDAGVRNSKHMMFLGAPGTGKTVVARILGEILREEKILSVGGFYEVTRKDLVGAYIGHTAPKTAEVCQAAYGSVLFIDEAYMLDGGGEKDYGREAISTLIAEMENRRDDFVVIFAGYEKELERLFDLNPGLRDRIPYRVNFENYNREELELIFYKMLPKGFALAEEFQETAHQFFVNLSDEVMNNPNFSNARFVRNLVERILSKFALRTQMGEDEEKDTFIGSDFEQAISDAEFSNLNAKKTVRRIGY